MLRYDQFAARWVIVHVTRPGEEGEDILVCVAVSADEDVTGLYYRYAFDVSNYNILSVRAMCTYVCQSERELQSERLR